MESKFPPVTEFIQVPKLVLNPVLDLWDERRGWQRSGSWVLYVLHDEGCLCFILNAVVGLNAAKINVLSKCCTPGFKWGISPQVWALAGIAAAGNVGSGRSCPTHNTI